MSDAPAVGRISWLDLTVPDADRIREFYHDVVGWRAEGVEMGGYQDYLMLAEGQPVAGVCHARGPNAGLPPQWLPYVTVEDLDASLARCEALGGKRIGEIRRHGPDARYCVIEDPAGAALALYCAAGPKPA